MTNNKDYCLRKANQHWEMAGLASLDGDKEDFLKHTRLARHWEAKARET
jgi:hypothetical protein